MHEKSLDDYADRFSEGLAEACVADVLRMRVTVNDCKQMLELVGQLCDGFSFESRREPGEPLIHQLGPTYTIPVHSYFQPFDPMSQV